MTEAKGGKEGERKDNYGYEERKVGKRLRRGGEEEKEGNLENERKGGRNMENVKEREGIKARE